MRAVFIAIVALAAGLAALLLFRARQRAATSRRLAPESILLEEAVVTAPVAPGMEGAVEIRKRGAPPLVLRARATDSAQAFARGASVRVIDYRGGCCVIESADEVHLVR